MLLLAVPPETPCTVGRGGEINKAVIEKIIGEVRTWVLGK